MTPIDRRRAARLVLLALIVAPLAAMKFSATPGTGPYGVDGSFYVNAARNVEEGEGLVTNVSMYHRGQTPLPTHSRLIYPLWALMLGYSARAIGLVQAVNVWPSLLYVVDLLLLYALTLRISHRLGADEGVVTPAHLVVLAFGTNYMFVLSTIYPYTEGLGFFFVFLALLLFDRAVSSRPLLWASLAGIAAGGALLTRTQLIVMGIAILIPALWCAVGDRRFARAAIAYGVTFVALVAYWYFFVFHIEESPRVGLPSFRMWVKPLTRIDWLRERWDGLLVSLSPVSLHSFFHCFAAAFALPLIGGAHGIVQWVRAPRWRLTPELAMPAACVFGALGTAAALNLHHQDPSFFLEWLFGYRHGLPMITGVAVAAAYLWKRGRVLRGITLACFAIAVFMTAQAVIGHVTGHMARSRSSSPTPAEARLAAWLDGHPRRPEIVTARSQHLSVYTHANIHWTECRTPATTTRVMLEKLPVDYVIVYSHERRCKFHEGLQDVLRPVAAFGRDTPNPILVLGRQQPRR